jgi:hypothetical protein
VGSASQALEVAWRGTVILSDSSENLLNKESFSHKKVASEVAIEDVLLQSKSEKVDTILSVV